MSPNCLLALKRQKRVYDNSRVIGWEDHFEYPLLEWARSADWYRKSMWDIHRPDWMNPLFLNF